MPSESNPFTPSFGISPPILSGRAGVLGRVEAALAHGPRHPDFTMLATGSRGIGKTVLLNAIEEDAHVASHLEPRPRVPLRNER